MKKHGTAVVCLLAFVMISALSWVYQQDRGALGVSGNVSDEKTAPVYRVQTEEKKVGLTFDAAWGCQGLEEILAVLAEKEAGATFFLTGKWMENYPEQVSMLTETGMELANGGSELEEMNGLSVAECQRRIRATEETADSLGAEQLCLFRPPLGTFDENLLNTADAMGYTTVIWSADSMDWKNYGAEAILQAAGGSSYPEGGAILRFRVGTKHTAQGLKLILDWLEKEGYRGVSVSDLMGTPETDERK